MNKFWILSAWFLKWTYPGDSQWEISSNNPPSVSVEPVERPVQEISMLGVERMEDGEAQGRSCV